MSAVIADRERRFSLSLDAAVVPAAAWTALEQAQLLIDQANGIVEQAQREADDVRQCAHQQGLVEGREQGLRDCAKALAALGDARAAATSQLRRRAADVAIGVVRHIAPLIGADRMVAAMVAEAMQKLVFEPQLLVRVHPQIAELARVEVAALGAAAAPDTEIIGDPELRQFDIVIESAGGVVRAGLDEQLEQARVILAAAEEQSTGESNG
jgi:flagellar biosynthesis/type III secretory pathway protein FliH